MAADAAINLQSTKQGRGWVAAAVTLVVFVALEAFGYLPAHDAPTLLALAHLFGPYGYAFILNMLGILVPIAVVSVARGGLVAGLKDLGLWADPLRPLLFGLIATSPAWIGFLVTGHANSDYSVRQFILLCWLFPLSEEVWFRAFAFGQLFRRARWSFWLAALVPALIFASEHLTQSNDAMDLAGIFAITAFGSVVFSYFFVRFGFNIWAPFALHAFLNTWWTVFTTNQTALGGWADNVFRFGALALAFLLAWGATRTRALSWLIPAQSGFEGGVAPGRAA